ncbi:hypothetical protein JOE38_002819 [Clavibacter michiganensis]|nr:hypothetical protein [Clavibacter michiganensis]MBM7412996.1 hypothetical protein [Clavibacter michiganensis]
MPAFASPATEAACSFAVSFVLLLLLPPVVSRPVVLVPVGPVVPG